MRVYNTLSGQLEDFQPQEEKQVKMYVCGPTVYNYVHIGNARPMIVFDTVRRYLEYKGYEVTYVQNFTDVDDKIIAKSNEEGISAEEVANRYIKEYFTDADGLGVKRATIHPRVTSEIEGIIQMIQQLIEKGFAYEMEGTVFYDTSAFAGYGKLSKKNQEELEAGARIAVDEVKKHPMDFVLWKPKKPGEPAWDSPWGEGRPGWHIECSVMARKYLGDTIDIHAGGEDLVFPHHENEIAQSEGATGKPFAKYWMHNRFLNINNQKMSKSLGNFFTVREVAERYGYDAIRFFMLNAHYRSPVNFSAELMEAACSSLERIRSCYGNLKYLESTAQNRPLTEQEKQWITDAAEYQTKFEAAMDNDFNTADALAAIFELVRFANTKAEASSSPEFLAALAEQLGRLMEMLGFTVEVKEELLDEEIEALIEQRQQARRARNFALADEIRDTLKEKGIVLEDTREGVRYKRV